MSEYNSPYEPFGGYPYPPKKSFFARVKEYFLCDKYIVLSASVTVIGLGLILYQFMSMLYSFVLRAFPDFYSEALNDYRLSGVLDMFYTVLCVGGAFTVAYILMKKMGLVEGYLPFSAPRNASDTFLLIVAGLGICFVGNIATNFFVSVMAGMGIEFASYNNALALTQALPSNAFEFILLTVRTAVLPAIFEEFAFRGVIMQPLRKYGDFFAIIVSAVLFGLVHGNMTQMPFAIIAGVALGYASIVSGSLWTGVIIHFLNNFVSLLNSFAKELLSDSAFMLFSVIVVYGIVLVGVAALSMFAYKNPYFLRLRPGKYGKHKKSKLAAIVCFIPSMTIALIWMISSLAADIYI
ncbi:MAG: CPBP family intramembrane metalloprotease [Clostridia bacterium]|nr:CPBP family intramembrane metalloprotease [Clostridia bacterium]